MKLEDENFSGKGEKVWKKKKRDGERGKEKKGGEVGKEKGEGLFLWRSDE